jgi:hypothetical protein
LNFAAKRVRQAYPVSGASAPRAGSRCNAIKPLCEQEFLGKSLFQHFPDKQGWRKNVNDQHTKIKVLLQ